MRRPMAKEHPVRIDEETGHDVMDIHVRPVSYWPSLAPEPDALGDCLTRAMTSDTRGFLDTDGAATNC